MAQKTIVTVLSDLSGEEGAATVSFGIDGKHYEIDLTEKEAGKFREALAKYVGAAREVRMVGRGRGRVATVTRLGPDPKAVRAWAVAQKITVPERGRLPRDVVDRFESEHATG